MQRPPALHAHTAFLGFQRLGSGSLPAVALMVKRALENRATAPILIFDDSTGRTTDIDTQGSDEEVLQRLPQVVEEESQAEPAAQAPRGRGRPKLNVVGREVTLLPRHWDWLNAQPGGASVTLRKLVEEARRTTSARDQIRQAREAGYYFMSAMAGDFPGFEEAARALFAHDRPRFDALVAAWPEDIRTHAAKLAFSAIA